MVQSRFLVKWGMIPQPGRNLQENTTQAASFVAPNDIVLITGAAGFIGQRVVERLQERGFTKIRCLVRSSTPRERLAALRAKGESGNLEIITGDLLSPDDCLKATQDVRLVYHLAAGRGGKSYPDAFLNSVITTRNLLDACVANGVERFLNVGSFVVYSNRNMTSRLHDETSPVEEKPRLRGEAYCYAKAKQDELVMEYGRKHGLRWVLVRPGVVYGPGNLAISGRVGIDTFGVFLHLGGSTQLPLTYVDNCADAIVHCGLTPGIDGEVFDILDGDLPTSRQFLRNYKRAVRRFRSFYVPKALSFLLCRAWQRYSERSQGQLPPVFNVYRWHALWKTTQYSNEKLRTRAGWRQPIPTREAMQHYFAACRGADHD